MGLGGNHLGLQRVIPNLRLIAACEIEAYAVANLVSKMENGFLDQAPVWSDCRNFPAEPFADRVDLFVASCPCQPFSHAGKRKGVEDERHLWPYAWEWCRKVRPGLVFLENVAGFISAGLATTLSDLEEIGYRTAWGIFSAAEVGAPHKRERVFILADSGHPHGVDITGTQHFGEMGNRVPSTCSSEGRAWPAPRGSKQYAWEPPRLIRKPTPKTHGTAQPAMGGNPYGSADWLGHAKLYHAHDSIHDEYRLLGNCVIPSVAEHAFQLLRDELSQ